MTKIKLFAHFDPETLEDMVNKFVVGKRVIDIKYQTITYASKVSSAGATLAMAINDRVLVIYEE